MLSFVLKSIVHIALIYFVLYPTLAFSVSISSFANHCTAGPDLTDSDDSATLYSESGVSGNAWSKGEANAFAAAIGSLGVDASWEGIGFDFDNYNSQAIYTQEFTNTSGLDLDYYLNFKIFDFINTAHGGRKSCARSSGSIDILLNGLSISTVNQSLSIHTQGGHRAPVYSNNSDSGSFIVTDDTIYDDLNDTVSTSIEISYSYEDFFFLEKLTHGESFTIEYILSAYATGMDFGMADISIDFFAEVYSNKAMAVPEPGTIFLLMFGLLGITGVRKLKM